MLHSEKMSFVSVLYGIFKHLVLDAFSKLGYLKKWDDIKKSINKVVSSIFLKINLEKQFSWFNISHGTVAESFIQMIHPRPRQAVDLAEF